MMPTILQTKSSSFTIDANALEDAPMITDDNTKISVISYTRMPNKPRRTADK
jgi:hypothetical protein